MLLSSLHSPLYRVSCCTYRYFRFMEHAVDFRALFPPLCFAVLADADCYYYHHVFIVGIVHTYWKYLNSKWPLVALPKSVFIDYMRTHRIRMVLHAKVHHPDAERYRAGHISQLFTTHIESMQRSWIKIYSFANSNANAMLDRRPCPGVCAS